MTVGMNNVFVMVGQDPKTKDFFYHERENNNGNPGKIRVMGDGKGDVRPLVNSYIKDGVPSENIFVNGQNVEDVFTKEVDEKGNISFRGLF